MEFVHALCPQQAIDRKTPIAWHAVLGKLDYQAAQAAVIALKHSQKFIDPSDIVRQAKNSADLHPSSRTLGEALEFANRRELDPAGGTPATEEFLKAKDQMMATMEARGKAAYLADHAAERKAAAWLNGAIKGRQPVDEPLAAPASPRWQPLPGDPPELRAWLARQPPERDGPN